MEQLMTVEEVMDLLRVGRSTLYSWVNQRRIPAVKIGACVRFRRAAIEKMIESLETTSVGSAA